MVGQVGIVSMVDVLKYPTKVDLTEGLDLEIKDSRGTNKAQSYALVAAVEIMQSRKETTAKKDFLYFSSKTVLE